MKRDSISNNVIRRLPRYVRKLDELAASGVSRVSSFELGQQLGFTPSQIRQDFSCFGEFGQQGYGYNVKSLRDHIATILGTDRGYSAIIIGVGHIGRALMDNFCFGEWGFNLKCGFDIDPAIIGKEIGGVPVLSIDELIDFLDNNKVDVAVLAVPQNAAVQVANILTEHGINAIWNFTNVELVPPNSPVIVENVHFSDSLLSLSYFISKAYDDSAVQNNND